MGDYLICKMDSILDEVRDTLIIQQGNVHIPNPIQCVRDGACSSAVWVEIRSIGHTTSF